MNTDQNIITKDELRRFLTDRVTLNPTAGARALRERTVEDPVAVLGQDNRGMNSYVISLRFIRCTFNNSVRVGNSMEAGSVSFESCVFNENKGISWTSRDFFKKFNLWLNSISNNFGRYWMQGLLFSFGVGLAFFVFLLISTDQYEFGFPSFDWSLSPGYLKFMNPLRFIDTEALFTSTPHEGKIALNGWSYFWDFLGRIVVAYGYYQTIQAFRRFGRKQ